MAFTLIAELPPEELPTPEELLASFGDELPAPPRLAPSTERALAAGKVSSSWCPWATERIGLFVPRHSTRGVELTLHPAGARVAVHVVSPALCTWTDWQLALELAARFARLAPEGVRVPGEGAFLEAGLRDTWLRDDERWRGECEDGCLRMSAAVRSGSLVRVGGPAGFAVVGPRTWTELEGVDPDDRALALVDRIQASVDADGYETYYPANLLCLDGRSGREVLASVLPPDQDTLLRDPEFVLLSPDLEDAQAELLLLPLDKLDDALPARVRWLDDRTAAVPAVSRATWGQLMDRAAPLLVRLGDLLDGPEPEPEPAEAAWWKFW